MPEEIILKNDIWFTTGCGLSNELPDYFIIEKISEDMMNLYDAVRCSDKQAMMLPFIITRFANWQLVKRNNKTICKECKDCNESTII
jgi:hypothetical protein